MYQAMHLPTARMYAVKTYIKSEMSPEEEESFKQEVRILRELPSHITSFQNIFEEPHKVCIVFDYCPGGDLQSRIERLSSYSEEQARLVMHNLLQGIRHCHDRRIAIRHLSCSNIMLTSPNSDVEVCIVDFAVAKQLTEAQPWLITLCGHDDTIAPEILQSKPYGLACDSWSVGVVLYMMLGGYRPFRGDDREVQIKLGALKFQKRFWKKVSEAAKSVLSQNLLMVEPNDRITADHALQLGWVRGTAPKFGDVQEGSQHSTQTLPR